jgi:hypothetical protein
MRLVVEPGHRRHLTQRPPLKEQPTGPADPARHQILVRRDAVGRAERPYQMRGVGVLERCSGRQPEPGIPSPSGRGAVKSDLFSTSGNDRDNRAAVRAVRSTELDLVGLAVYGPRNAVDKVLKGARMHP